MKRMVILFLLLASAVFGAGRGRYSGSGLQIAGNSSVVNPNDDLQSAYDRLKSASNNGKMGVLSATNWRTLLLSPGTYILTTKVTFDTDFVAIASISSNPSDTILQGGINEDCLLEQTCDTLSLAGFKVLVNDTYVELEDPMGGFWINGVDNVASKYFNMSFEQDSITSNGFGEQNIYPCASVSQTAFKGVWEQCTTNWRGFRASGDNVGDVIEFDPIMIDCHAIVTYDPGPIPGPAGVINAGAGFSFGGDGVGPGSVGSIVAGDTGLIIKGTYYNCSGGDSSFSGCTAFSSPIHADAKFYNCHAGKNSFVLSEECAGYFYNCTATGNSFGGSGSGDGTFTGEAVNCTVGTEEGGVNNTGGFGSGDGGCSGILRNCILEEVDNALEIAGALIDGLRIKTTEANGDAIIITDSLSEIYDSTILVDPAGTGVPINAGSALNVVVAHCRMNNADNDADGLGANVTNLVGTSYDVIDDDIK